MFSSVEVLGEHEQLLLLDSWAKVEVAMATALDSLST